MVKYIISILLILTGIVFIAFPGPMLKRKYGAHETDETKYQRMSLIYRINGVVDITLGVVLFLLAS